MVSISHLLNRSPAIKRESTTKDDQGSFTTTLATVSSPKGRRQAATGNNRLVAGREEATCTHIWYFDPDVDVRVRDVIEDSGIKYEVLAVLPPSLDDFLKVQTREFQHG